MTNLTQQDREQLARKGISEEQLNRQLECFKKGFPYLKLASAASVDNGILAINDEQAEHYIKAWNDYKAQGHRITKFVPASGAASRMFKNLFEFLDADRDEPQTDFERKFFERIHDFAFFDALDDACFLTAGMGVDALIDEGRYKEVVSALLSEDGLDYGSLPKALLQFHSYEDCVRTPLEEHLAEAALYASSQGQAEVHFTVSSQHRELFEELIERVKPAFEEKYHLTYHITLSEQKPSTDTVAATPEGEPFRQPDGSLLFRPGGHGALIENLSDLQTEVVFIKNIDNVVPDALKPVTIRWKQILAGLLVEVQRQAFGYQQTLESGKATHDELQQIAHFVSHTLQCHHPALSSLTDRELADFLRRKLSRPIRVCGMVRNQGEPGGGPFCAYNPDGTVSLQILESSQIDPANDEYQAMFRQGTHFNPVDLVCAVRDSQGRPYHLPDYVDPQTGFISSKSKDGRELRALELPGLWNGAMSDWNTLMVEVPIETFNPVKTVNDLLRPQHQG